MYHSIDLFSTNGINRVSVLTPQKGIKKKMCIGTLGTRKIIGLELLLVIKSNTLVEIPIVSTMLLTGNFGRGRICPRVVKQNGTAHLGQDFRQLIGAGRVASHAGGPRGCGCTWDDLRLTGRRSIRGRRRARPRQEPRDTAMA